MARAEGSSFDVVVAGLAGLASVVLVLGTLAVEQIQVTHEVQLWAPHRVREGDRVPMRALVMTELDGPAGPRLVVEGVSGAGLAEGRDFDDVAEPLRPAAFETVEGEVRREEPARSMEVRVVGASGQLLATAAQPVEVLTHVSAPLPLRGRLGDALQVLALARPPELVAALPELDVRIEGGVCIPEVPCRLWFTRGASQVIPQLTECTTLELGATHEEGELVSIDVVVHGPEARCHVLLPPLEVATDVQLPVGLATPWIEVETRGQSLLVRGEPPIGRDEMFIDVFVGHRWVAARTLRRGRTLELEPLGTGMARIQARADIASSERAYQRAVFVTDVGTGQRDGEAEALEEVLGPAWAQGAEAEGARVRWARLELEAALIDVAPPVSGVERDHARLAALRATMRSICVSGVVLAVLAILGAVTRRGLASARQAREVLLEAGADSADAPQARWRSWLVVLGFVAAIALAFVLGAGFLVARPFFMG